MPCENEQLQNDGETKEEYRFQTFKRRLRRITSPPVRRRVENFKVRRHKSAFWSVQLSIPDSLRDWINNCPAEFQDKPLKWAVGLQLVHTTVYFVFLKLMLHRLYKPSIKLHRFLYSQQCPKHIMNAIYFSLDVSVWAWVSNFNIFIVIEMDVLGFTV